VNPFLGARGEMQPEAELLRAADAYQRVTDWHTRRPFDRLRAA